MSFLNLTFSYIRFPYVQLNSVSTRLDFRAKRRIFFISATLFLLVMVFYLYLAGDIVTKNLEREALKAELFKSLVGAREAESLLMKDSIAKNPQFFGSLGYQEAGNLQIIKRNRNVTESSKKHFLY